MKNRGTQLLLAVAVLLASGCGTHPAAPSFATGTLNVAPPPEPAPARAPAIVGGTLGAFPALKTVSVLGGVPGGDLAVPQQARYIAQTDKLQVLTSASDLRKSWDSAITFCGTVKCEVVSSSISSATPNTVPSGEISMRVVPEDAGKLFSQIEKLGKVAEHSTEREDLTTSVIDTEAKLKNLTAFRDSLRAMLAKPSVKVGDLVEIQKQLADTQAELDSETAQRKVLANQTEKVAVEVSFRADDAHRTSPWESISAALSEAVPTLAESTASLISTIFAILPWLIVIVPVVWLVVRAWKRFRRRKRNLPAPPPASA